MISALALALELSAAAALVAALGTAGALSLQALTAPLARHLAPARRADLAMTLALVPLLLCLAVVGAAAASPLASVLGLAVDHCPTHSHHPHLCLVHFSGLRPALAALGAVALAIFAFRAAALVARELDSLRRLEVLERLGSRREGRFTVISIPGALGLCHAAGVLRRRVVVSADLLERLSPSQARAALAHEEAHLARRDPAACLLLSVASLFWLPGAAAFARRSFLRAMEEACDAEAAQRLGDPTLVAEALVVVAALQARAQLPAPAFGETHLESRVQRLLGAAAPRAARALWVPLATAAALTAAALAVLRADALHHAVETALHLLF